MATGRAAGGVRTARAARVAGRQAAAADARRGRRTLSDFDEGEWLLRGWSVDSAIVLCAIFTNVEARACDNTDVAARLNARWQIDWAVATGTATMKSQAIVLERGSAKNGVNGSGGFAVGEP